MTQYWIFSASHLFVQWIGTPFILLIPSIRWTSNISNKLAKLLTHLQLMNLRSTGTGRCRVVFLVIMWQVFYTALFSCFASVASDLSQSCLQSVRARCSSGQVSDSLPVALVACLRLSSYCNVKHDSMSFVAFAGFFSFIAPFGTMVSV